SSAGPRCPTGSTPCRRWPRAFATTWRRREHASAATRRSPPSSSDSPTAHTGSIESPASPRCRSLASPFFTAVANDCPGGMEERSRSSFARPETIGGTSPPWRRCEPNSMQRDGRSSGGSTKAVTVSPRTTRRRGSMPSSVPRGSAAARRHSASRRRPRVLEVLELQLVAREEADLDPPVPPPASRGAVGGHGPVLGHASRHEAVAGDLHLLLQEANDVGGAGHRELPVGGESLGELAGDRLVVGMSGDLDDLVRDLGQRLPDLAQHFLPRVVELRLARVEDDLVDEVHHELAALLGDEDVALGDLRLKPCRSSSWACRIASSASSFLRASAAMRSRSASSSWIRARSVSISARVVSSSSRVSVWAARSVPS